MLHNKLFTLGIYNMAYPDFNHNQNNRVQLYDYTYKVF